MEPVKLTFKFKDKSTWTQLKLMRELSQIATFNTMDIHMGKTQATFLLSSPGQVTPFLTEKAGKALEKLNLELIELPETRAKRTVFIPKIPAFIATSNKEEIKQMIIDSNDDLIPESILFVGSISSPSLPKNNMKIIFQNSSMTKQAINEGLNIGNFYLYPEQIIQEEIIRPPQCGKCHKLDHETNKCSATTPICSRCSGNHQQYECQGPAYCINCEGAHSALLASCPAIKEKISLIRKNKRSHHQQQHQEQSNPPPPPPPPAHNAWGKPVTDFPSLPVKEQVSQQKTPWVPLHPINSTLPAPTTQTVNEHQSNINGTLNHTCSSRNFQPYDPLANIPDSMKLQYDAYKTFAKDASPGNPVLYMKLMNEFFKQIGLNMIELGGTVHDLLNPTPIKMTASAACQTEIGEVDICDDQTSSEPESPPLSPLTPMESTQPISSTPKTPLKSPPPKSCNSPHEEHSPNGNSDNNQTIISKTESEHESDFTNKTITPVKKPSAFAAINKNEISNTQISFISMITPAQRQTRQTTLLSSSCESLNHLDTSVKRQRKLTKNRK